MAISDFQNFQIVKNIKIYVEKIYFGNFSPLKPFFEEKNGLYVIEPVQVSFSKKVQLNTYKNGRVMHFSFHYIGITRNHNIKMLFLAVLDVI